MSEPNAVWIAVATHPNAEDKAIFHLERQGYECYCPRALVRVRQRRRHRMLKRPFFPGYVFVRLNRTRDQWRPIMYSRGVRTVVRFGEQLGVVPPGVVESLIDRERRDGLRPPPAAERLRAGQNIALTGTLFDDFVGTVESIDAKDRICVLLEVMERTVKLVVPFDNVAMT